MFLKELNTTKKDKYFIILIAIFSIILTGYYINFNIQLGIYCSDVYVYLLNSLYFTGENINSTHTIYLSPIICFLTSILFDLGLKDTLAIYIVTGAFSIIGNIGLYLLLKTRFSEILSLCGVILYSTFAINLTWLSNGTLDIPAASISILIILFTILSVKANPKYFKYTFSLFVVGVFTRYTVILILPVLVLYYLYENDLKIKRTDLKEIKKGIIIALILSIIIFIPILMMSNGEIGAVGQISNGISGDKGSSVDLAYNTDTGYYVSNFLNFISTNHVGFENKTPVLDSSTLLSGLILIILALGCIFKIPELTLTRNKTNLTAIILFSVSIITFTHISSFITIILVFLGLLLIGKNSPNKTGLVMISWMLVYYIFFSYYDIKVNRYIIPTIAPLIYMIISCVEIINVKIKNENIIPIILIVLFIIQGFGFVGCFDETNEFIAPQEISTYLISQNPQYHDNLIGVYNMRFYHWYLGSNVTGIESSNQTAIDSSNVTYYISDIPENLNNYTEIKEIDNLYLYERRIN